MMDKIEDKTKVTGCGKTCFFNGVEYVKCGKAQFDDSDFIHYCDACRLKKLGVIVGAVFYEIAYHDIKRILKEYTILKLNDKSVRIRRGFQEGSTQRLSEYTLGNDKVIDRFARYSTSVADELDKTIRRTREEIEYSKVSLNKTLPKHIKSLETELESLDRRKAKEKV